MRAFAIEFMMMPRYLSFTIRKLRNNPIPSLFNCETSKTIWKEKKQKQNILYCFEGRSDGVCCCWRAALCDFDKLTRRITDSPGDGSLRLNNNKLHGNPQFPMTIGIKTIDLIFLVAEIQANSCRSTRFYCQENSLIFFRHFPEIPIRKPKLSRLWAMTLGLLDLQF